ncbi:PAS domain-containing protein [Paucibacter sp. APW11]|uniref:histidine kinase n=1 Tax=Roseateles aquae TaxID=3077235 RepID=A0ABU3PCG4_9BURK|nr:PAS domain-containing protein [Paucibacter sp. APW11]MDT8999536.1 PAS domain-containing protein [Paucibacter sp. APW11]
MLEFDLSPTPPAGSSAIAARATALPEASDQLLDEGYVLAFEAITAPVLIHAGLRIIYANTAMQRLLGYGLAELRRMPHYGWAAEASLAQLQDYGERCMKDSEQLPALECEALTANGSVRQLEISARSINSPQGRLVVVTCQDLSDIRHVQNSLLEIGRVMQQILESNPAPTFVLDSAGRISHWNAACAQLTGVEASAITGRSQPWHAFHDEERPLLAHLLLDGDVLAKGRPLYGDALRPSRLVPKAYELEQFFPKLGRWLFCTAAPLFDIQGQVVGVIETLLDVTERRAAEEALKRHKQELENMVAARTAELLLTHHELEAFLENASVGIIYTHGHRIARANKKFGEIFELNEASAVGLSGRRFFADREAFTELIRQALPVLAAGESLALEVPMQTAQGQPIWVQLIAYASDPQNPTQGVWWLLQDRSDVMRAQAELVRNYGEMKQTNARLAEAQNQLLQSEKLASIGQLAAGVAHEINNPIGFVSSNLGSMRRYMESMLQLIGLYECLDLQQLPTELRGQIAQLRREADFEFIHEDLPQLLAESDDGLTRVKKIVQDLKDFSRVDQSDWQMADINQGLDSTLNVVMNEVKYKAEIKKDYGKLPAVRCLAAQLNQVFMNMIVNAGHAISGRGEIRLSTCCVDDWVCIAIGDNGSGMAPEVQRRIFDPFFTTKPVGQGTGLGLSLSFSIVQKHGGRIELESEVGKGSTFRIWIPVLGPKAPGGQSAIKP